MSIIDRVRTFIHSDRGVRAAGLTAGIVLITGVASFGANKPITSSTLTADPGADVAIPSFTPSPKAKTSAGGVAVGGITGSDGRPLASQVPKLDAPNIDFGLRTQGITANEVKVGFSYNQAACGDSGVLEAMLGSATVGDVEKSINAFARYINDTGGIGGRDYKPMFFDDGGSGCPEKSVAAAVEMADEKKVFLAIPGLHVVSDYIIKKKVPVWGGRDDPASLAKYGANGMQLLEPIEPTLEAWASFGKYYLGTHDEKEPPCWSASRAGRAATGTSPQRSSWRRWRARDLQFIDIVVFKDDVSTAQQQATAAAIKLRDAGCKQVWFMAGNPIGLIFFTNAATQNHWFPKWTCTSYTAIVDTELAGGPDGPAPVGERDRTVHPRAAGRAPEGATTAGRSTRSTTRTTARKSLRPC